MSFDVITAPFPYVEASNVKRRPYLLIGRPGGDRLLWVAMITSATHAPWPHDVILTSEDLNLAGLRTACLVRVGKLATIESGHTDVIGCISKATADNVMAEIKAVLAAALPL